MMQTITVRQLNLYVKSLLDGDKRLCDVAVIGEISNLKKHYSSGHWYFTLKDNDAAVKCVMFKAANSRVRFEVQDGLQVVVRARASLYEKDGAYQLYAEEMLVAGEGNIALGFEQIKQKLMAEGLFDESQKRPIPSFPKKIAVITSSTGAAVRDILNITARRYPVCQILLHPVLVQGEAAARDMIKALDRVYECAEADLIIIGRGGGSAEDLWAFNDEQLARKIYESPVPVISAVGHETDFTICDFVADLRAPTPSAAAELAVPDIEEIRAHIKHLRSRLENNITKKLDALSNTLIIYNSRLSLKNAVSNIDNKAQAVDSLNEKLHLLVDRQFEKSNNSLLALVTSLENLSPLKIMTRGYAAVRKGNEPIKSIKQLVIDDDISLYMSDGKATCKVKEINDGKGK